MYCTVYCVHFAAVLCAMRETFSSNSHSSIYIFFWLHLRTIFVKLLIMNENFGSLFKFFFW